MNQTVALRQLDRLGYTADYVSGGQDVLEALERISYDLVLMDCQMPGMDGYQATAAIRRKEKDLRHTVIIAMTAHAYKEDREKCLSAGMDDYLSKPVKPSELDHIISRWLSGQSQEPTASLPPGPSPDCEPDINREQMQAALGAEGPEYASLLNLYLQTTAQNLEDLARSIENGKADDIARIAHSSAGANALVGMRRMAALLKELERDARKAKLEKARALGTELQVEFERIKTYISHQPVV